MSLLGREMWLFVMCFEILMMILVEFVFVVMCVMLFVVSLRLVVFCVVMCRVFFVFFLCYFGL